MTTKTSTAWSEDVPALKIELMQDGCLRLEAADPYDNGADVVTVHPLHLRRMAEKLGLVREMSATEAGALRMVDKLARRLGVLHERISQVHEWMWQNKNFDQCDINIEAWHIDATLDLSTEFLTEIEESRAVVTPRRPADGNCHPSAMANGSRGDAKPTGFPVANRAGSCSPNPPFGAAENPPSVATRTPVEPSAKACANPSGKASSKASVKASGPGTDSLFGGDHG